MNRPQVLSARKVLEQTQGKVLLINPPVIDSRYAWIKWNQPLDLLKLGSLLVGNRGCEVRLYDFMLPSPKGTVPRRQAKLQDLPPDEPVHWQFGQPWKEFDDYLDTLKMQEWVPDSVWITTLASFWWQTVPVVANHVRNRLGHPQVVLYGNYPALEATHAARFCFGVDVIVRDHVDLSKQPADFSLYGERKLRFRALDLRTPVDVLLAEIEDALGHDTSHFCFFNENIFRGFDNHLKPVLEEAVLREWELYFHGICGVETRDFPLDHAQLLADAHFSELHFEPALTGDDLVDEPLYRAVMQACQDAGFVSPRGAGWESRSHYFSAFLWVGRPDDDLNKLVWNALKLLQLVGMVIPKPYSPSPGTKDYELLVAKKKWVEPEDISPHRMPFAGLNGIERGDYKDLYRMTAFLNTKVRDHTFDFLGDTYLAQVIRESLAGRRWDI